MVTDPAQFIIWRIQTVNKLGFRDMFQVKVHKMCFVISNKGACFCPNQFEREERAVIYREN